MRDRVNEEEERSERVGVFESAMEEGKRTE